MFVSTKTRADLLNLNQIYCNKLLILFDLLKCWCSLILESGRTPARVFTDKKRFQGSPKTAAELASFAPPITEKQQLPLLPCHGSQVTSSHVVKIPWQNVGKEWKGAVAVWLEMVFWIQDRKFNVCKYQSTIHTVYTSQASIKFWGSPPLASSLSLKLLLSDFTKVHAVWVCHFAHWAACRCKSGFRDVDMAVRPVIADTKKLWQVPFITCELWSISNLFPERTAHIQSPP